MKWKFIAAFIIITLPMWILWQNLYTFKIKVRPLKGDVTTTQNVRFTPSAWLNDSFQPKKEKYMNDEFNLRPDFIRLNNQVQYYLFKKAHARDVIIGKDEYLFEKGYIDSYNGKDFIGDESIRNNVRKIKLLQDSLAAHGQLLITVIAADKAYFYPDKFPDSLTVTPGKRNYEPFLAAADSFHIRYINYNAWLLSKRKNSPYPLYPRHGIHWSLYSASLVVDSINKYIGQQLGVKLPDFVTQKVDVKPEEQTDRDVLDGLNIFGGFHRDYYGYPYSWIGSDSGRVKPSVLAVADSYYWSLFNYWIFSAYTHGRFWYYNHDVFSTEWMGSKSRDEFDFAKEVASHKVIILFGRVSNIHILGWGFVDQANDAFAKHLIKY